MNQYLITTQHDHGRRTIQTSANSTGAAIRIVMAAEGCPRCAIIRTRNITPPAAPSAEADGDRPYPGWLHNPAN